MMSTELGQSSFSLIIRGVKMRFDKLNIGWDAEPNAPIPIIEVNKSSSVIRLSFYLNSFIHDDVDEEDKGVLGFSNCYKYRLGATNDEGFYRGQCRYSNTGVKWGNFYRITNSDWRLTFPSDEVIVNKGIENNINLHHYLFYFRDETFECIADTYSFHIIKG